MVSIFGIALIIYIMFYMLKVIRRPSLVKDLFFISIVLQLVGDVGYLIKINNVTIEYNYFLSAICGLFSVIYIISKGKINKKDFFVIIIYLVTILLSMLYPLIFNLHYESVSFNDSWDLLFSSNSSIGEVTFDKHAIGMYFRVVIFIISFYIFSINLDKDDLKKYSKKLYKISWIIIGFSILEFLITNYVDVSFFRNLVLKIFGQSDATYLVQRKNFLNMYMPMGFMREPSSYAKTIYIFAINNLFYYKFEDSKVRKNRNLIIFNILIMMFILLFSNSMSGYIYILAILFIVLYTMKNKLVKVSLFMYIPIFILPIYYLARNRLAIIGETLELLNMDPSRLQMQSELIRFYSINNNLKLFFNHFFVGCGFGTIYSYSALITLLANIGLIGVSIYSYINWYINSIATNSKQISWLTIIIIILTYLFTGHMSNIIYLETFAYQIIVLKSLDIIKKTSGNMTR